MSLSKVAFAKRAAFGAPTGGTGHISSLSKASIGTIVGVVLGLVAFCAASCYLSHYLRRRRMAKMPELGNGARNPDVEQGTTTEVPVSDKLALNKSTHSPKPLIANIKDFFQSKRTGK